MYLQVGLGGTALEVRRLLSQSRKFAGNGRASLLKDGQLRLESGKIPSEIVGFKPEFIAAPASRLQLFFDEPASAWRLPSVRPRLR